MPTHERYIPHDKQRTFHTDPAKIRFFGGAMGWGKSKAGRMELVRIGESAPDLVIGMFRRTYEELASSIIRPLLAELPPSMYTYNKAEHILKFTKTNSIVLFRHANHKDDVYRYQGSEFDALGIDEIQHWDFDMFQFLKTRVRTSKPYIRPSIFLTGNPGGIGHTWIKRIFVDREFNDGEDPDDYSFTFSNVYDNPTWQETDPDYIKMLESLDPISRRAYLEWDWNVFKGQYFWEWKPSLHICQPFQIPDTWERAIALDYGLSNPTSILWGAKDPSDNVFYIYRQVRSTGWLYDQVIDQVIRNTPANEWHSLRAIYADPALAAKSPTTRESFFQIAKMKGLSIIPANNDRIPGWQVLRRGLAELEMQTALGAHARIQVFSTCTSLIKTLPALIYDKSRLEDCDTNGDDHDADALRYLLNSPFGAVLGAILWHNEAETIRSLNAPIKEEKDFTTTKAVIASREEDRIQEEDDFLDI